VVRVPCAAHGTRRVRKLALRAQTCAPDRAARGNLAPLRCSASPEARLQRLAPDLPNRCGQPPKIRQTA
jgi:hypothetical protein